LPPIARRCFQGAQDGYGSQRKALLYHGRIDIPPAGDAAPKATAERIMPFNPARHILAMQQRRKPCRRRRAAIATRGITAAGLTAGRGCNARKPNNAIPKPEGFAIKNTDLRGFSRDGPIRRGRAEKIGWQAKAKDKRRNNRASRTES
jgi:hypothetical protein